MSKMGHKNHKKRMRRMGLILNIKRVSEENFGHRTTRTSKQWIKLGSQNIASYTVVGRKKLPDSYTILSRVPGSAKPHVPH